jgi:CDP-diacylglycerol--glycerol-3-phosphate 3-phosphatidyltransferase
VLDLACSVVLLSLAVFVAAAYAKRVATSGAAHHPRIERAGGSPLLGKRLMEMGYWAMHAPARACMAFGVTANAISWWSLAFAAAAALALGMGHYGVGAVLSVASFVCDALDGIVARETATASDAGALLDAVIDRYAELLFLSGIALHERADPLALGLVLAAIAGAVMVSYATAKAEALGVDAPRGAMRRQERAVYFVIGTALVPLAGAVASRWALPPWVAHLPLFGALGLVAVVGNVSAVRRLRTVATTPRNSPVACPHHGAEARARSRAHVAAGDTVR